MGYVQSIEDISPDLGVDILVNYRPGTGTGPWECIAPFGQVVEGVSEGSALNTELASARSANNLTFAQVRLPEIIRQRPSLIGKLFAGSSTMIFDDKL